MDVQAFVSSTSSGATSRENVPPAGRLEAPSSAGEGGGGRGLAAISTLLRSTQPILVMS